jgi:DNA replication protein DnaC
MGRVFHVGARPLDQDRLPSHNCERLHHGIAEAGSQFAEENDAEQKLPLLIIDDFGMRKLPHTAAEDLLEIIMRRYERFSTLLTSNRPVEDWGKLLGDVAAVGALLDRLLHHGHVLKCGPRSWRTKTAAQS